MTVDACKFVHAGSVTRKTEWDCETGCVCGHERKREKVIQVDWWMVLAETRREVRACEVEQECVSGSRRSKQPPRPPAASSFSWLNLLCGTLCLTDTNLNYFPTSTKQAAVWFFTGSAPRMCLDSVHFFFLHVFFQVIFFSSTDSLPSLELVMMCVQCCERNRGQGQFLKLCVS